MTKTKTAKLQDLFLARARRSECPVTLFLMNGFQMRGTIGGFDSFTVILTATANKISSTSMPSPPSARCGPWMSPTGRGKGRTEGVR